MAVGDSRLGFGLPGLVGMMHFHRTGEVWTFMGFPTYGGGAFQRLGMPTSIGLLAAFLVVCLAEVAIGGMIWSGAPLARALSLVLLPFELVFWVGFTLPFGPPLGIARTVLVLLL
jgi:hypothetical protein